MDDTAVEEDLGGVGDAVEVLQGVLEFVVVVVAEGRDPSLDFLLPVSTQAFRPKKAHLPASGTW
jgi:hypothetical protein